MTSCPRHLDLGAVVASPLLQAWRLLETSGGYMAVGRVAQRIGWSRRHPTAEFNREFGLPPKEFPSIQDTTDTADKDGPFTATGGDRMDDPMVWPVLSYSDAPAAAAFLVEAFGFEQRALYTAEGDPHVIEHAELRWPLGGGVMLGTAGKNDSAFGRRQPGNDAVYVVCDDPDALFDRALAAGAETVRGLKDESYGSRGFTVRDPGGVLWSFGTYRGE